MKSFLISIACALLLSACNKASENKEYTAKCFLVDTFDYTKKVETLDIVDEAYFIDSIFAGDSRMGSFVLYNQFPGSDIVYIESLSLNMIDVTQIDKDNPDSLTMYQHLINSDKKNFYLLFGINELGWNGFEKWKDMLDNLVFDLKNSHPSSNIYLIGLYTPTKIFNYDDETIRSRVDLMNGYIKEVATKNLVYYLNPDDALSDENQKIFSDYVFDGIHFNKTGAGMFAQFIKTHRVDDRYVKENCY